MSGAIVQILMWSMGLAAIVAILLAVPVKFFARPLTIKQSILICAVASAIGTILILGYFALKYPLGIPQVVDNIATLTMLCVMGTLITRQARTYKIEKTGRLGVGAKAILSLFAFSWLCIGIFFIVTMF